MSAGISEAALDAGGDHTNPNSPMAVEEAEITGEDVVTMLETLVRETRFSRAAADKLASLAYVTGEALELLAGGCDSRDSIDCWNRLCRVMREVGYEGCALSSSLQDIVARADLPTLSVPEIFRLVAGTLTGDELIQEYHWAASLGKPAEVAAIFKRMANMARQAGAR